MLRAVNPANGEVVREVEADDEATIERKIAAAASRFRAWRKTPIGERAEHMRNVARQMRHDVEHLARTITEEMGKPIREARGEIEKSALCCDHYAEHAERYLAPEEIESDAQHSRVQYLPLGAVLGILPWNSPFWLTYRVLAPALMAGNVCLIKPDRHVPGVGQNLQRVFADAGVPNGVLDVLLVGSEKIERVLRDDRVCAVSFTGSTRGGTAVASVAASESKPAVLELGGSDPAIVLEDADLEAAAQTLAFSRLIATGQSCIAPKRFIIEAPVYDRFVELVTERLRSFKLGDPMKEDTDVGPVARRDLRDELHDQVTRTIEQGARCVLGGQIPEGPGSFYPITLLIDVTREMTAFREEVFGPVACVTRAANAEEAIALANDTEYGLASSIWTTAQRGESFAADIEAGQVVVNGIVKTDPRLPSGGIKRSGYGRELGPHGIREFVNAQQVWIGPARK